MNFYLIEADTHMFKRKLPNYSALIKFIAKNDGAFVDMFEFLIVFAEVT